MSELKTRIQLKRDTSANWNAVAETFKLLPGELAFETDTGYVKIGIYGEGELSAQGALWKDTPYVNINDVSSVHGLEAALAATEAAAVSKTENKVIISTDVDIADVEDGKNTGDIAIVKKTIADDKLEYTAYVWDANLSDWCAMDGNYNADNVYMAADIGLAGAYTQVGNIQKAGATGTLSCKGWSVTQMFNEIFDKTVQPTIGAVPTASVTLTNAGAKEVGTSFTPSWSVSFSQGKYNQPWVSKTATVNDGTTASAYSVSDTASHSATTSSGSFAEFTVADNTNYKVSATVDFSAGAIAKDNKGNNSNPVVQRSAGTTASVSSSAVTGWRRCFWGYRTVADGALTAFSSADIRNNIHATASRNYNTDTKAGYTQSNSGNNAFIQKFKVLAGTKQLIFAVPHSLNTASYKICKMVNTSIGQLQLDNGNARQAGLCTVEGLNGATAVDYDIWTYTAEGSFAADTEYTITWSAS